MEIKAKFITYQELANALGCSYQQVAQVHSKRIIETFHIDKKRLPKAGMLPLDLVEKYFDLSINIQANEKTI
ncbi:hypothetical protein LI094_05600 [[Clostridium] saccharogumia]|uniref:hypothetical protein n=1 Tax=Thomasclavelia saccharogumia TaxID=341225 RepID=UPI001D063DA2|nr:hypothetical protein [Thomasclavelia saccharogumia]MCB6706010.1 hypothetical protein [Thomasclavelia saccharogumia]